MDNTRDTKEITTPITSKKLVINTYITGREKREIQSFYFSTSDEKKADLIHGAQDMGFSLVIQSVDGETDKAKIKEILLDLPSADFSYVLKAVETITAEKELEEKKTS